VKHFREIRIILKGGRAKLRYVAKYFFFAGKIVD